MHRATVTTYIESADLPDRGQPSAPKSKVKQYDSYLRKRWQEGCRNSSALWKEFQQLGYEGQYNRVYRYLQRYRTNQQRSPRSAACIFMTTSSDLTTADQDDWHQLTSSSEALASIYQFSQDFISMFADQAVERLDDWRSAAGYSEFKIFKNFAVSLREDLAAVKPALTYNWSHGQTEGQVNRLKTIKRHMYGEPTLTCFVSGSWALLSWDSHNLRENQHIGAGQNALVIERKFV